MKTVEEIVLDLVIAEGYALDAESFRVGVINYWKNMNDEELLERYKEIAQCE